MPAVRRARHRSHHAPGNQRPRATARVGGARGRLWLGPRLSASCAPRHPRAARLAEGGIVRARHAPRGAYPELPCAASAHQPRRRGRAPRARRGANLELFGSGASGSRSLSAGSRGARLAECASGAGRQCRRVRAACKMPGADPQGARRRAAQLMVQCALRSLQQRTRAAVRALLRTGDGGRALRRRRGALPAGCFRAEQSRGRATHHRAPARADSSRLLRDRILRRGGRHRPVGDRSGA